jgi:hypothetical protein
LLAEVVVEMMEEYLVEKTQILHLLLQVTYHQFEFQPMYFFAFVTSPFSFFPVVSLPFVLSTQLVFFVFVQ